MEHGDNLEHYRFTQQLQFIIEMQEMCLYV